MALSTELLPIEVLHGGLSKFCVLFLPEILENILKICSHPEKDVDYAESRLLQVMAGE